MKQRKFTRVKDTNYPVDISDGRGFFAGIACNISRTGLYIEEIPNRLNDEADGLILVLQNKNKNFKMNGKVRWSKENLLSKNVGVEITKFPIEWLDFVTRQEPQEDILQL